MTDHDDWPAAEVIVSYRSQSEAEFSFRQMKDPHVVSFSPMFHWTEHNITVHVLTCVLALQVAYLMRLQAQRAGLRMSVRELLTHLTGIGETILIYPAERGRPKARRMLTETTSVLEAVIRRACPAYLDMNGAVQQPFERANGTLYAVGSRCNSVRDALRLLRDRVAQHKLKNNLIEILSHIEEITGASDGCSVVYDWRNSSLHGETTHQNYRRHSLRTFPNNCAERH